MQHRPKLHVPARHEATPVASELLVCGGLQVDVADQRVRIDDHEVVLPPKVYELLVLLLNEPRRVHTRESLFERIWPGTVLLDSNLTTTVWQLRRALAGPLRGLLRTVPKVGYSWDGDVQRVPRGDADDPRAEIAGLASAVPPPEAETRDPALADRGSRDEAPSDEPSPTEAPAEACTEASSVRAATSRSPAARRTGRRIAAIACVAAVAAVALSAVVGWSNRGGGERPLVEIAPAVEAGRDPQAWQDETVRTAVAQFLRASSGVRVLDADALPAQGRPDAGRDARDRTTAAAGSATAGAQPRHRLRIETAPASGSAGRRMLIATLIAPDGATRRWREPADSAETITAARRLADAVLQHLVGASPQPLDAVPTAALAAFENGLRADIGEQRPSDARRHYEQALAAHPDFALARLRLGDVLGRLGHYDLAAAQLRAAAQSPQLGTEERGRADAHALALTGKVAEAAAAHAQLARRFPDEPEHELSRIAALIRQQGPALAQAQSALAALDRKRLTASQAIRVVLYEGATLEAQGRSEAALARYRHAIALADAAGDRYQHGHALMRLGQWHRGRLENAAAIRAYDEAAAAFRTIGMELQAQIAEVNALLAAPREPGKRLQARSGKLLEFARRATASGNVSVAGQALDAAAADHLVEGDYAQARALALRASALLRGREASLRNGPEITLTLAEIRLGLPVQALRRLDRIERSHDGIGLDQQVLRIHALLALGEPLRALEEVEALKTRWRRAPASAEVRLRVACAEVEIAARLRRPGSGKAALDACAPDGRDASFELLPAMAALAIAREDDGEARHLERIWRDVLDQLPTGDARAGSTLDLAAFQLERGRIDDARASLERIAPAGVETLAPPIAARYWLTAAGIALAHGHRSASLQALSRADRAIGAEQLALRREYRLLRATASPETDRDALARLRDEARTAGDMILAQATEAALARGAPGAAATVSR